MLADKIYLIKVYWGIYINLNVLLMHIKANSLLLFF